MIAAAEAGIVIVVPTKFGLFTRAVNIAGDGTLRAAETTVATEFVDKASAIVEAASAGSDIFKLVIFDNRFVTAYAVDGGGAFVVVTDKRSDDAVPYVFCDTTTHVYVLS
jgi:hypothetical protein